MKGFYRKVYKKETYYQTHMCHQEEVIMYTTKCVWEGGVEREHRRSKAAHSHPCLATAGHGSRHTLLASSGMAVAQRKSKLINI